MATPPEQVPSAPPGDSIDFAAVHAATPPETTNTDGAAADTPDVSNIQRLPTLRSASEPTATPAMTASSTPLGMLNNARRPNFSSNLSSTKGPGGLPQTMQDKMRAFHLSRQGTPPVRAGSQSPSVTAEPQSPGPVPGLPGGLRLPPNMRPAAHNFVSAPVVPKAKAAMGKPSLGQRRGMKLPGGLPGAAPAENPLANGTPQNGSADTGSQFSKFSQFVDTKNGTLNFAGKAVIHGGGIDFSTGNNFSISLDEVDTLEELGKGNYGTVYKVRHSRPKMRRPGLGLAGNKALSEQPLSSHHADSIDSSPAGSSTGSTTGIVMAMKEIRLELDEAKFAQIIMELDILHRCLSPYIIDFYGAFFQEGAVYICIEFMDGGSIDKIYGDGIPENVLRKITYGTVQGLKTLKDDHNIIHRDVKPTNILVNTRGQVKICDFGVSGNLVASIAKTNIGCQSYMAPERISGGGMSQAGAPGGTYSVQSDIWSLGLSIIECAMGRYPYPPETYNNIFSQLSAIVDGEPPDLPEEGYSELARDFVRGCLHKIPKLRPTYSMLLAHGWLASLSKPETISEDDEDEATELEKELAGVNLDEEHFTGTEDKEVAEWARNAIDRKMKGLLGESTKPALHNAPLDSVNAPAGSG
ncbi:putative MAP kinase kinase (Pbs2) [Coleophoma cylindrospora]|uniref:mitogen-activated protein kinase kinase n=1 Tax=Coleophoma cylindrospora TaxID=1849047 RepID=A0A3D8S1H4_9HELO|nr:putative MAP kinase kinase (Pbs2) [Coleophoma cylindrospora]